MFKGSIAPIITPFKNGHIDTDALVKLVAWQKEQGSNALIVCGTSGEFLMLSRTERQKITDVVMGEANGEIPVIVGTGALTTAEAIEHTLDAKKAGAHAALILVPYFVKPSQEALYQHYTNISQTTDFPIFLYNNPGQAGTVLELETILRLAKDDNIIGIKDPDPVRIKSLVEQLDHFIVLAGRDRIIQQALKDGCNGFISATTNLVPKLCADLYAAHTHGDARLFEELCGEFEQFSKDIYVESIPSILKYALSTMEMCENEVRNPLIPIQEESQKKVDNILETM